ncbi:MAG: hypothetical protein ACRD50_17040 [Candidatus Acidiferrales bacterium]
MDELRRLQYGRNIGNKLKAAVRHLHDSKLGGERLTEMVKRLEGNGKDISKMRARVPQNFN